MLVAVPRGGRAARRIGAAVLPLVLLGTAACSTGASQRPAIAYEGSEQQVAPAPQPPEPTPIPPLGGPSRDNLAWQDCTSEVATAAGTPNTPPLSCAKMASPLDSPEEPGSGIARLSLLSAGSGAVPLVVLNDAGGEPGTLAAARLAQQLPPELLRTFRIVGMDRRGTGSSDPMDCVPPPQRQAMADFDPRATDPASLGQLQDVVRQSSQRCLLTLDERSQANDTSRAANDLEQLRQRLGVTKLHAIGRGESSRVLTTYAEQHPHEVGRMVLDGAPDPSGDAMREAESRAGSAEGTFDAFAASCARSGPCPLGPDVRRVVSELVERTRRMPLPAAGGPVTAGSIVRATLLGLSEPSRWPELTGALDAAEHGDGSGIAAIIAPLTSPSAGGPPRLEAGMITSCNDTTLRVPPQQIPAIAADWVQRFPLFGGTSAQNLLRCGVWPVPQEQPPAPGNPALPPILVVSTAHDPSIPAAGSEKTARQLPSGVVLNWLGSGHGAVGRSDCATAAVTRFLTRGTMPARNTVCPA